MTIIYPPGTLEQLIQVSILLFSRFMVGHFLDLWDYACKFSRDPDTQRKCWSNIKSRAEKQTLLRAASSIQIASKFSLQATVVQYLKTLFSLLTPR